MLGVLDKKFVAFYNATHRGAFEKATQQLIEPFAAWPAFTPAAAIVLPGDELSGVIAWRTAEAALSGALGDKVYFTGAVEPKKMPYADKLISKMKDAGIPPPGDNEAASAYMKRVYLYRYTQLGGDPWDTEAIDVGGGNNMKSNIQAAMEKGGIQQPSLAIVALPHEMLHAISTVRTVRAEHFARYYAQEIKKGPAYAPTQGFPALRPVMAWPKETGVDETNWKDSPEARFVLTREAKCNDVTGSVNIPRERALAANMLREAQWYARTIQRAINPKNI